MVNTCTCITYPYGISGLGKGVPVRISTLFMHLLLNLDSEIFLHLFTKFSDSNSVKNVIFDVLNYIEGDSLKRAVRTPF